MQENQPSEEELEDVLAMSESIVAAMKRQGPHAPVNTCISALGEVMIDFCHFLGLNRLGFIDVCRQLIDQYGESDEPEKNGA